MTVLSDLMSEVALRAALDEGLVRVQSHPDDPTLRIYNYTDQAVYSREWNHVTTQCRGLIVHGDRVVARPWPKFFNYGEHAAGALDLTAPVEVTDKADGSLGILYTAPDGRAAIATRGSFTSEQAIHATEVLRSRYEDAHRYLIPDGETWLFEIVYPGNRIVLDYGDLDDLILLGRVNIATGEPMGLSHVMWPGEVIRRFSYSTLADALAAEPRPNAEGLVVRYRDSGLMLKIKQSDYVALHRIITGFTARRLWERAAVHGVHAIHPDLPAARIAHPLRLDPADVQTHLDAGPGWVDEVRKVAPEEFTAWIDTTLDGFMHAAQEVRHAVSAAATLNRGKDRKQVAHDIAKHPHRGLIFAALDGKPIEPGVWAAIRPEHERPLWARGEDVA